ncbi:MAG TPA: DUF2520 domain-containing protein [Cyclobacteriaceae bacterium]|nr:DUF2520 domain-containing protein [Cyclobacteriaceae bacterium]
MPTVSFIGSGNLAWHLAPALDNLGFVVKEVFSARSKNAAALTERLYQAEVKTSLDFSDSPSKVFFVAISDEAIADVAKDIILPEDAILVHTSGSQPLEILQFAAAPHTGVFYPLQTFTKARPVDFKNVPVFIEASDSDAEKQLTSIAKKLTTKFKKISSEERKGLHVAAVFASNFPNHMLRISKLLMDEKGLNFDWLKPLVLETINKALAVGPEYSQTGPAVRGDLEILDEHLKFLKKEKALAKMYELISQDIINRSE